MRRFPIGPQQISPGLLTSDGEFILSINITGGTATAVLSNYSEISYKLRPDTASNNPILDHIYHTPNSYVNHISDIKRIGSQYGLSDKSVTATYYILSELRPSPLKKGQRKAIRNSRTQRRRAHRLMRNLRSTPRFQFSSQPPVLNQTYHDMISSGRKTRAFYSVLFCFLYIFPGYFLTYSLWPGPMSGGPIFHKFWWLALNVVPSFMFVYFIDAMITSFLVAFRSNDYLPFRSNEFLAWSSILKFFASKMQVIYTPKAYTTLKLAESHKNIWRDFLEQEQEALNEWIRKFENSRNRYYLAIEDYLAARSCTAWTNSRVARDFSTRRYDVCSMVTLCPDKDWQKSILDNRGHKAIEKGEYLLRGSAEIYGFRSECSSVVS